jgi:hypothetical protein
MNLKIKGNEAIVESGTEGNFLSQMVAGTKGKVKLNTPFGKRDLKLVKEFKPEKKVKAKKKAVKAKKKP